MSIRLDVRRMFLAALLDVDKAGQCMPMRDATTAHRRSKKWRRMRRKWNREHTAIVRRLRAKYPLS